MKEFIEYVARSIVDSPDEVAVEEEIDGDRLIFRLHVAEHDKGKIIGRQGRIAQAMRTLLRVAAVKQGTRAYLEIRD